MKPLPLLLTAVLLAGTGCTYLEKRANDLGDCFKISGNAGFGISAHFQVGPAGGGLGFWGGLGIGLEQDCRLGVWREAYSGFLLAPFIHPQPVPIIPCTTCDISLAPLVIHDTSCM